MRYLKPAFLFLFILLMSTTINAQKKTFDIVSYTPPKGWTETAGNSNTSYSRAENGNWAQIVIYKTTASSGDIDADFDNDWNELVAVNKSISAPEKTKPQPIDGWTVLSGRGTWQYNGANVTSQLTVYSNSKVSISFLCNFTATTYVKDYQALLASLILNAEDAPLSSGTENNSSNAGSSSTANKNSIVGIWVTNIAEDRGYINGFRMYTGGYMRKEYQIKEDGTYIFREKDWRAVNETIYFVYESGTWTLNGNKLTITPNKGKAGWWNKDNITNDVNKWGNFQKAAAYKIQPASYTIEIKTDSYYGNSIILNSNKATERDGGQFNDPPYRFAYSQSKETLIDNPPGFKN